MIVNLKAGLNKRYFFSWGICRRRLMKMNEFVILFLRSVLPVNVCVVGSCSKWKCEVSIFKEIILDRFEYFYIEGKKGEEEEAFYLTTTHFQHSITQRRASRYCIRFNLMWIAWEKFLTSKIGNSREEFCWEKNLLKDVWMIRTIISERNQAIS